MVENQSGTEWRVIGASVRGASHLRAGVPKQDAISWLPEFGQLLPQIVAVSDGHGSAKCFRSEMGAMLAVNTAMQVVQNFLNSQPDTISRLPIKQSAEEQLPQKLVHTW